MVILGVKELMLLSLLSLVIGFVANDRSTYDLSTEILTLLNIKCLRNNTTSVIRETIRNLFWHKKVSENTFTFEAYMSNPSK